MSYTAAAVVGVLVAVVADLGVLRTRLLARRLFWVAYAIMLGFQLLTNGVLTGQRIVRYDPDAVLGGAAPQLLGDGRLLYAPVEDVLFGFALVTWTLTWWVWWGRRGIDREPAAGPPRRWLRGGAFGAPAGDDGTSPRRDGDGQPT